MTCDQLYASGNVASAAQAVRGRAMSLQPEYRSDAASLGGSSVPFPREPLNVWGQMWGQNPPKMEKDLRLSP